MLGSSPLPIGEAAISSANCSPKMRLRSVGEVRSCIQTPVRSGLPSAVCGAGAARFTFPFFKSGLTGLRVAQPLGVRAHRQKKRSD